MASFRSSNDCISDNFDDIYLELSTHANFEVRSHLMPSKYDNSRSRFL